jgi:hypothetical protein
MVVVAAAAAAAAAAVAVAVAVVQLSSFHFAIRLFTIRSLVKKFK